MAHKIIGVDFGGAALRLARFEAGFRKAVLLSVESRAAGPVSGSPTEQFGARLAELQRALADEKTVAEEVAIALPGELLTFRTLDLPFNDPKRIESVLGYELEAQVMTPIEELIVDHVVVGQRGAQTRVLVAAAPRATIESIVKAVSEVQLPVRFIGAAPLAYAAVVGDRGTAAGLVVDIGHDKTDLCVVRAGRPEMARSLPRGGRHFTEAIAASFQLEQPAAEQAKVEAGFIGNENLIAQTPGQKRMDACLREAARPLIRELKQTLASYRASYGSQPEQIWLCGGASQLPGLREHIGEETGVTVEPLPWQEHEGWAEIDANERQRAAVAVGIGIAAATPSPQVSFRKGEFSFRSDYSFLRGKAIYLAGALLAVLACAAINAYASLRGLRKEQEQLSFKLKKETIELFGSERLDARAVSEEVRGGPKGQSAPPIPTVTAFDVLDEISRHVPPRDKVKLDVLELDIKPKKVYIKATAESAQQVDDLTDALKKIECFEDIRPGKLSTVSAAGATGSDGKETRAELKQFTLDVATTCP